MPRGECFVAGCVTRRRKPSFHLFSFPKNGDEDLKAAWLSSIPARERPFDFDKDVICHLHFTKDRIDTSGDHKSSDEMVETPRQRWRLLEGAVPTLFQDSSKEAKKDPENTKTKDDDECEDQDSEGGESSMLPPGYLRMLADACKSRTKRPAKTSPGKAASKSRKLDKEVSMLPPGYLKMLSNVCEEQSNVCVQQLQSTSNSKPSTVKSSTVLFMLPNSPTVCELHLESETSITLEDETETSVDTEPPSPKSPEPSSPLEESMQTVPEEQTPESDAEMLTAVESVVTVTTDTAPGFDLVTISNQLIMDGLMCDAWTCDVLKDWQSGQMVLSCAELVTTHCGAEVQKSIMITNQGNSRIYVRHVDVSSEFASFMCFNYSDVKALLSSVKQAKLCSGLSNCDSMDEFCGVLSINNVWFSENCQQIVAPAERQCRKCKALRSSLEEEPGATKRKVTKVPKELKSPEMTAEQARDRLWATLRDQIYLKQRLSQVKKTNAALVQEVQGLRSASNAKLTEVESGLEMAGLPEKQKLAFTTAMQAAKRTSTRGTVYGAEWLLECNGILRQSNKAYEHLRTRNILPLPTKKHLRKLLKNIPLASAAATISTQNVPIALAAQMNTVTMSKDGTMTALVFDEAQMQQLLLANSGVRVEELVVTAQSKDHGYSLT